MALDVGGTTIDSACVSADGELIGGLRESDSPAAGTRDEIVNELARVIDAARARADDAEVIASLAEAGLPDLPIVSAPPGNMAIWGAAAYAWARTARSGGCRAG